MSKFVFKGAYPSYFPVQGVFAKPGEVHELDAPLSRDWVAVEVAATAVAPVVQAAVSDAKPVSPVPVTEDLSGAMKGAQNAAPAVADVAEDALKAAEALLEANPELAARLVEEAKNA